MLSQVERNLEQEDAQACVNKDGALLMKKKTYFLCNFYIMRLLFSFPPLHKKDNKMLQRWCVLAFYRIALCLNSFTLWGRGAQAQKALHPSLSFGCLPNCCQLKSASLKIILNQKYRHCVHNYDLFFKKKKKKKNTLCTEAAYSKCWQIFIKQEIHSLCNDLYNIKNTFQM